MFRQYPVRRSAVLDTLLTLYFWVIIISALLTWVRPDPYNPIVPHV